LHLTRNLVVFEVYNPYSIVQLSEVLQDLRILRGERALYTGRAVVSNLVPTGLMVIVSATLVDPWSDLVGLAPGQGLREEVERFVHEWDFNYAIRPSYRLTISRIRAFLSDISRLLDQVDVAADAKSMDSSSDMQRELFEEIEKPIVPKIEELLNLFEIEASQIPPEEVSAHKTFAHHELHPLFLCSPYVHRIYTKPLGYAGDYEMVNMMLRDPFEGQNTYAKLVNFSCLQQLPVKAHQNRIEMLETKLKDEAEKLARTGRLLQLLNVGCGPAVEIQKFIKHDELSQKCKFHLLDFNEETINYARERLNEAAVHAGRKPYFQFIHKSIHELLKEIARHGKLSPDCPFDFIYCAGLFDYLSDRICKRLMQIFYDSLASGGLLLVTNVHPKNPTRYFMEHLAEWHLIYRSENDMADLAFPLKYNSIYTDQTGVNVFLEIRKEGS